MEVNGQRLLKGITEPKGLSDGIQRAKAERKLLTIRGMDYLSDGSERQVQPEDKQTILPSV